MITSTDNEIVGFFDPENGVSIQVGSETVCGSYSDRALDLPPGTVSSNRISEFFTDHHLWCEAEKILIATAIHPFDESVETISNPLYEKIRSDRTLDEAMSALKETHKDDTLLDLPEVPRQPGMGHHSFAVSAVAYALAELCNLSQEDSLECAALGLLHDGDRIAELLITRIKQAQINPAYLNLPDTHGGIHLLRQNGMSDEALEQILKGSQLTGHESLASFLEVDDTGRTLQLADRDLIDYIVHFADDLSAGSSVTGPLRRMKNSDFESRYPYHFKNGLRVNKDRGLESAPCGEGGAFASLMDIQCAVANAIAVKLVPSLAGKSNPASILAHMVQDKLVELKLLDEPSEKDRQLCINLLGSQKESSRAPLSPEMKPEAIVANGLNAAYSRLLALGDRGLAKVRNNAAGEMALRADIEAEDAIIQVLKECGQRFHVETEEHGKMTLGKSGETQTSYTVKIDGIDGTVVYERDRLNGKYATLFSLYRGEYPTFADYVCVGAAFHGRNEFLIATPENGLSLVTPDGAFKKCKVINPDPEEISKYKFSIDMGWKENRNLYPGVLDNMGISSVPGECSAQHFADLALGREGVVFVGECSRVGKKPNLEIAFAYGAIKSAGGVITTRGAVLLDNLFVNDLGSGARIPVLATANLEIAQVFWGAAR